jgi:hypothetical protein
MIAAQDKIRGGFMSPLLDRSKAKESGFAQVRSAIRKLEGNVDVMEFGQWSGGRDADGKLLPPKEFLEVKLSNVHILEASEPLSMDVEGKEFTFRINCSDSKGSFWVEAFLKSAEDLKVLIPEGLVNKRVTFEKYTLVAKNSSLGVAQPKFNSTNYIIRAVGNMVAGTAVPNIPPAGVAGTAPTPAPASEVDPMDIALELAVGKTEAQFRTAISLDPRLAGNSILPLAKAGAVTSALVKDGKLVEVKSGNKTVYAKP